MNRGTGFKPLPAQPVTSFSDIERAVEAVTAALLPLFRALVAEELGAARRPVEGELLTAAEAAVLLGRSVSHVRDLYHAGVLKGQRLSARGIRIFRSSVYAYKNGGVA